MSLYAGAAAADITPPVGIELAGFVAREQPSTGVHDPLFARALYLENEGERVLWINADIIAFKRSAVRHLTSRLADEFLIPATNIVLSATHTHSGPPTIPLHHCGELKGGFCGYLEKLESAVCEVARTAIRRAEPTTIFGGQTTCSLAIDRRGKASAHTDHVLGALGFKAQTGKWIAVLTNYPIHPVVLDHENRLISGDLLGEAARQVERRLHTTALFTNGACGNQNPPRRGDFEDCAAWARQLSDAVFACLDNELAGDSIGACKETFLVPVEQQTGKELKEELIRLREMFQGEPNLWNTRSRLALREWAGMMMHQNYDPHTVDLQIIKIGEFRFACVAAEVFSVMSERLRDAHGGQVHVVGYANGDIGYLCPEAAYEEGGYEVDSAFMYYGTAPIQRGSFEALEQHLSQMLAEMA
jgi:hypothetical protein